MKVAIEWVPRECIFSGFVPELREILATHAASGYHVVIDFTATEYMDSGALSALVAARERAGANNTRLVVCGLNDDLKTLFELTHLDGIFHPVENIAEARARLLGQDPPATPLPSPDGPTLTLVT